MLWAEQLKEEYSKIAKENMLKGTTLDQNLSKVDSNRQVAEDLDMSKETFRQAKYIYKNADEEMIKNLDENKLSINKAYTTLKEQLKQKDNEIDNYKQQLTQAENNKRESDKKFHGNQYKREISDYSKWRKPRKSIQFIPIKN